MIRINKITRVICVVVLIALLAFGLTGCSFHNDVLDEQILKVVECLNTNKQDELYSMFHPEVTVSIEEFSEWYQKVNDMFSALPQDELKLKSLNVRTTTSKDNVSITTYQGGYGFDYDGESYLLSITYIETESACGITNLHFEKVMQIKGATAVIGILITLLQLALLIFTVVDIVRKKPKRYVLWIILVVFLTLVITVNNVRYGIPIGCVIYWCVRKKLLAKKQ